MLYRYRQFHYSCKTDDIYKNIAEDVESRFDTFNFEIDRPLPKGKNKNVIGLMRDQLVGQYMKELAGLREKTYKYLKDNNDEDKKVKGTKSVSWKKKQIQDYQNCLEAAKIERKINYSRKK